MRRTLPLAIRMPAFLCGAFMAVTGMGLVAPFLPDDLVSTPDAQSPHIRHYKKNPLVPFHKAGVLTRLHFNGYLYLEKGDPLDAAMLALGDYPGDLIRTVSQSFDPGYYRGQTYLQLARDGTAPRCFIDGPPDAAASQYLSDALRVPESHITPTADAGVIKQYIVDHERRHCTHDFRTRLTMLEREADSDIAAIMAAPAGAVREGLTSLVIDTRAISTFGHGGLGVTHAVSLIVDARTRSLPVPSTAEVMAANRAVQEYIAAQPRRHATHTVYAVYDVLKDGLDRGVFADPLERRAAALYVTAVERQIEHAPVVQVRREKNSVPVMIIPS